MRPRKGTKTSHRTVQQSDPVIYKDETPEGDENRSRELRKVIIHSFIKMRPRKGTKTLLSASTRRTNFSIYKDETPEGDEN